MLIPQLTTYWNLNLYPTKFLKWTCPPTVVLELTRSLLGIYKREFEVGQYTE